MIKFMKYCVKNIENGAKARVYYTISHLNEVACKKYGIAYGVECVTLYAKDYNDDLEKVFGNRTQNDSDSMTDYFETSRVRIFQGDPLYVDALARCKR